MKQPVNCKIQNRHWTKTSQWAKLLCSSNYWPTKCSSRVSVESARVADCVHILQHLASIIFGEANIWGHRAMEHNTLCVWSICVNDCLSAYSMCIYLCFQWSNFSTRMVIIGPIGWGMETHTDIKLQTSHIDAILFDYKPAAWFDLEVSVFAAL